MRPRRVTRGRLVRVLAILLGGTCAGCSTFRVVQPDAPPIDAYAEPPLGAAEICVVRPHSLGVGVTLPVLDGAILVGATRGPSYFCYRAAPGRHVIRSGDQSISLDARAGHREFVHQSALPRRFARIPDELGRAMLSRCAYALLLEAPDSTDSGASLADPEQLLPAAPE